MTAMRVTNMVESNEGFVCHIEQMERLIKNKNGEELTS